MQQVTHIEVVLGDWQKLPDECLVWSEEWKYLNGGIYAIAQAEVTRELSTGECKAVIDELARIWDALDTSYRTSVSFEVTVVELDAGTRTEVGVPVRIPIQEIGVLVDGAP